MEAPTPPTASRLRTQDIAVAPSEQVDFSALLLPDPILRGIRDAGWLTPSPVQLKSIPIGRFGSDLIAQAKSGTGKTGVFAIIALSHIDTSIATPQVLILEPTREIAQQSCQVINTLGKYVQGMTVYSRVFLDLLGLQCKTFIGGVPLEKDAAALKNCHIAVGTPGRILQLQEDKRLRAGPIGLVILDEADKLFESPMHEQIGAIMKLLKEDKQVLALSATFRDETLAHVNALMRQPQMVMLAPDTPSLEGVRQFYYQIPDSAASSSAHIFAAKVAKLLDIFSHSPFHQCLLFTNDRGRVDALKRRLQEEGWPSAYIAGGLPQQERSSAIAALRAFKIRVLISTDLTARGIDVDRVNLVVNLDMPHDPETYLHRIGRTGTLGIAISFVDRNELQVVRQIVDAYKTSIDLLPDVIPPELYSFELTAESDKRAAQKLALTRDTKKDNARPVEASEFVAVPCKRPREVTVEAEDEAGEEEAEEGEGDEKGGEYVGDEEEKDAEAQADAAAAGSQYAANYGAYNTNYPYYGYNHWSYTPSAVLGAFSPGAPGFAQAAAWFWAGYGYALQAMQYYSYQQPKQTEISAEDRNEDAEEYGEGEAEEDVADEQAEEEVQDNADG